MRRNGRTLWYRQNVEAQALLGQHTHALAPDGMWCVTRQPAGYLWSLVRRRPGPTAGKSATDRHWPAASRLAAKR